MPTTRNHSGFTLVELMIGIAISMLILLAALTALVNTSFTGKTVTDASQLQQQASVALRIIGLQLRQAGALRLESIAGAGTPMYLSDTFLGYQASGNAISGVNGGGTLSDTLNISYQGVTDSTDCLGNASTITLGRVDNTLALSGTNLVCTGSDGTGAQVIADGVEDFQVRYGVKSSTTIQYMDSTTNWAGVSAVEVCLQLVSATTNNPSLGSYVNCRGNTVARDGRLRKIFRNTFLLRNQDA